MSTKYLGEKSVDISETEYRDYQASDWALLWIEMYGGIDGDHHRAWCLDQVARILKGTVVLLSIASWSDGQTNERFSLGDPPAAYWDWVRDMKSGEDGPETYDYDFGVAP